MSDQASDDVTDVTRGHGAADAVFGDYRVVERLGEGAMGVVYRAYDPRLDRPVALKLVRPRRTSGDPAAGRARLVAEARALARIRHPNVLSVYDVGTRDDVVFLVLELVDGVDLSVWLRARPRSWRDVVSVFAEVAGGLRAVHAAGLVHRDVKPANILVERGPHERGFGRVLLADFGVARSSSSRGASTSDEQVDAAGTDDAALTDTGRTVGTPLYMAPEQHSGETVGPAADQYGFCVALYEALYGHRPFRGNAQALLWAKLSPPDRPPLSRVPRWVWRIVRRGLSPQPEDRFSSVDAIEASLRAGRPLRSWIIAGATAATIVTASVAARSVVGTPVCAGPPVELRDAWSEARQASLAAIFTASRESDAADKWPSVRDRIDEYAQALDQMHDDACEASYEGGNRSKAVFDLRLTCMRERWQSLSRALALLGGGDPDVLRHADDVISALDPVAACADAAVLESGIDPPSARQRDGAAEARRLRAEAKALQAAGRYDDAARVGYAALELARAVGYAPAIAEALVTVGELRQAQSRLDEARVALEEAITIGIEIGYDRPAVNAAVTRAWIAAEIDRDVDAAEHWTALGRSRLARIDDQLIPTLALHNSLGAAYSISGRLDDARREFEAGLGKVSTDPEHALWAATLHSNLGSVRTHLGQFVLARESYLVAMELFRVEYGDDHPSTLYAGIRLAKVMDLDGQHVEAIAEFRRGLARLERVQAAPSEVANGLISLGLALRNAGDDQANQALGRAVEMLESAGDDVSLAHALVGYGHSCVDVGLFDAAFAQFDRAITLLERMDSSHPDIARALIGIGRIRERQRRRDLALALYQRAVNAAVPNSRGVAVAWVAIAQLHRDEGRYDEANAALDRQDQILAHAPLVLRDDRLNAAIVRLEIAVLAGGTADASPLIERLAGLLDQARPGGTWRLGRGELALGRAYLARGERDLARAALTRALDQLRPPREAELIEQARRALADCDGVR